MKTVSVESIKPSNRPGATQAYVTFVVNNVRIIDARIVNGSKGTFVALPQKSYENREGQTKYVNLVEILDEDVKAAIESAVLEAWRSH